MRKPTPSYHIVRSGRVEQLALPCTRIPLAPVPLGALRGTTCSGRSDPGSSPRGRARTRGLAPRAAANPGSSPRGRARARGLAPRAARARKPRALKRARSAQSARLRVRGRAESARGKLRRAREARPLSVREALRSSLETLPATLRSVPEALRSALEALPATLRSVPETLRSALDVLRSAPEHAASSGNSLRGSWTGERLRPARPATTPASSLTCCVQNPDSGGTRNPKQ